MRDLLDLINTMSDETSVELHDSFDIELSENFVIETGVVALTEDAIVIEGDDKTCELLEEHGLVLEKMIMGLPGDQGSKVMGEMDDGESYDENQPIEFYIALHDLDDNSLFIGAVSKYNGNWHESTVKGNPPYNWGSNYMSYLTPSDVWQHIRNDFRRGYELGGPFDTPDEAQEYADSHFAHSFEKNDDELNEAEYHGRKVSLGKPFLTPDGPKKRSVYVRKPNGKVVKVNFGDKKMRIKKSSPAHRKSFRARHNCANPGPRWKARYWSCRAW
jgi:hypothetical protein